MELAEKIRSSDTKFDVAQQLRIRAVFCKDFRKRRDKKEREKREERRKENEGKTHLM